MSVFTQHRPLLFTIAYQILGSAADAEDVVQDSYLRWSAVDAESIAQPRAYLVQMVTRTALNHLRAVQRRREEYVGPWLPEPIRTDPCGAEDDDLSEAVSMAMMLVLETLSPTERAVFVLSEVFGYPHGEIAEMTGKTPAAVRQLARRARAHDQARRRRFEPSTATSGEVIGKFLLAAKTGDIAALMTVLSPNVVEISDGGAATTTARRPIHGPEQVARYLAGVARKGMADCSVEFGRYNAMPAVLFHRESRLDSLMTLDVDGGLITAIYIVRNPDKLRSVHVDRKLSRVADPAHPASRFVHPNGEPS